MKKNNHIKSDHEDAANGLDNTIIKNSLTKPTFYLSSHGKEQIS